MAPQLMMPVNDTNAHISMGWGEGEAATRTDEGRDQGSLVEWVKGRQPLLDSVVRNKWGNVSYDLGRLSERQCFRFASGVVLLGLGMFETLR